MKREFDIRQSLEDFFKEKRVTAVFITPRANGSNGPIKLEKPLDLSELTQRDH